MNLYCVCRELRACTQSLTVLQLRQERVKLQTWLLSFSADDAVSGFYNCGVDRECVRFVCGHSNALYFF